MKRSFERREDHTLPVRACVADGAILWIDDATGRIMDRYAHPQLHIAANQTHVERVAAGRAEHHSIDLVGSSPLRLTPSEAGVPKSVPRLPHTTRRLLPGKGVGS